jgi:hypothetical protein
MKIKQLKEYYELGILTGFSIIKDPVQPGWLMVIEGREGRSWTLETALGKPKSFASLDTLAGELEGVVGTLGALSMRL